MFFLLGELNLWSFDDDIFIKDTDFSAFRYHDKKTDNLYEEGKQSYSEKRGKIYAPQNKKGTKLKDCIKYLEEQLKDNFTIYCQWCNYCTLQIMLSSGLLIYIQVDVQSGNIDKIMFDKYFIGKISDRLCDVIITQTHIVCTYIDCQMTLVNFAKTKKHIFSKISRLEPKITTFDFCGPNGRRLEKKLQLNNTGDLILIWWKSTMNEVYPWSPTIKEQDRANVYLYRLMGMKVEFLCYLRTEFDPLCVVFSANQHNVIHSLEQKVSRKGEVTIEWRTYEVSQQQNKLHRIAIVSVQLPTHTSCVRFSPKQDMLLLCCIDGSVILHDRLRGINNSAKAAFIPTSACWHNDGMMFTLGNERGQFQHFDVALSCIKCQMLSEDTTPTNILDLSSHFRYQPTLLRMDWNRKNNDLYSSNEYYNHGDSLFLLLFERGPLGVVRFIEGENYSGDILVHKYLTLSQVDNATSLLLSMNWNTHPQDCMHSLNQIVNYLFKLPLTTEREDLIQNALGSYHVPAVPINRLIEDEYANEVRDLTRRFFHHLLRYRLFEKAFRLAIDLNDHDLFMDLHFYAVALRDVDMATASKERAKQILHSTSSRNSTHSTCSRPSCSVCNSQSDKEIEFLPADSENEIPQTKNISKVKYSAKHRTKKTNSASAPIHFPCVQNGVMSTSFNDVYEKIDSNLMSTSFSLPQYGLPPLNYNDPARSNPNSLLPQMACSGAMAQNPYLSQTPYSVQSTSKIYDNLTAPFGSLTVGEPIHNFIQPSINKSMDNITDSYEKNSLLSSSSSPYEYIIPSIPSNTSSPIEKTDFNVISTSFSNDIHNINSAPRNSTYDFLPFKDLPNSSSLTVLDNDQAMSLQASVAPPEPGAAASFMLSSVDPSRSLYSPSGNVMSTSFNDLTDDGTYGSTGSNSHNFNYSPIDIPPPASLITNSITSYMRNLPKKNYNLSSSTIGLTNVHESPLKLNLPKPPQTKIGAIPQMLPRQSSVSEILNSSPNNNNPSTRKYRFDYDLNVPYNNDNFNASCPNINNAHTINYNNTLFTPYDHNKPSRLALSQNHLNASTNRILRGSNLPPTPITNASSLGKFPSQSPTPSDTSASINEKPKVKFSDTVTHILVPNLAQGHRPVQKRATSHLHPMDPKRELAESLPLCLGNDDYLKDFQPLSKDQCIEINGPPETKETTKIKIIHFGLL